jgi:hypothetical protein
VSIMERSNETGQKVDDTKIKFNQVGEVFASILFPPIPSKECIMNSFAFVAP